MRFFRPLLLAAASMALATAAQAQTKWDLPAAYPASNFHSINLMEFAADVDKATGGKLKITVHAGASLFKAPEIKRAVQGGQAQIGEVLISNFANEWQLFGADALPFLADSWDDSAKLWKAQRPFFDKKLAEQGLMALYAVPWPPQGIYSKKPLASGADMKGVKFRAYNPATSRVAELLGQRRLTQMVQHNGQFRHLAGQPNGGPQMPGERIRDVQGEPALSHQRQGFPNSGKIQKVTSRIIVDQVPHSLENRLSREPVQLLCSFGRRIQPDPANHSEHPGVPRGNGQHALGIGNSVVGLHQNGSPDPGSIQRLARLICAEAAEEGTMLRTKPRIVPHTAGDEGVQGPHMEVRINHRPTRSNASHSSSGTGASIRDEFVATCSGEVAPAVTFTTAGCRSGNWSAAVGSSTPKSRQTAASARARSSTSGGA